MAEEEQTYQLYDFLYRDSSRIASYYAQRFSGRLSSFEETHTDTKKGKLDVGVDVHFVSAKVGAGKDVEQLTRRVIDPHDMIATDVLDNLDAVGRIRRDVVSAPNGALVTAQGTIFFIERFMLEGAISAIEVGDLCREPRKTSGRITDGWLPHPSERTHPNGYEAMKAVFSKLMLPSACILETNNGVKIAGTIKESGMEEPISAYYFKHGTSGLSEVHIIGVKEQTTQQPAPAASLSQRLLSSTQMAAQVLSDFVFPTNAVRITPIAIFRKI